VLGNSSLDALEADWQKQWLIERGIEIVSEASRHLTVELKARNPDIPWAKVAGIVNVLRHDYGNIAAPSSGSSYATIYRRSNASVVLNLPPQSQERCERSDGPLKPQPVRLHCSATSARQPSRFTSRLAQPSRKARKLVGGERFELPTLSV
jgi:Protein of unknown function DUF86